MEALLKLATIVHSDLVSLNDIEAIIVVSQTPYNLSSVIERTVEIQRLQQAKIIFGDIKNPPACRHREEITQGLIRDVDERYFRIVPFPEDGPPINTYTEMVGLLQWLAENPEFQNIAVVASPFHQLRSMMSVWSIQAKFHHSSFDTLRFYSIPGTPLPWGERAVHSQGILTGKRHDFILTEIDRVAQFHLKGDLISPTRALEIYISQRTL